MAEMRNDLRRFIDVLLVRKFTASTLPLLPTQSQNGIESGTGPAAAQRACGRTILGLAYCMVHSASSPAVYSLPSQGVPQM